MVGSSTRALAVDGLEILDEIGRGAHAIVFRARRDGCDYALKMLRSDLPGQEDAAAAIRREAGLLACVDDPCVGRVYEVGAVDGTPYLVMELLDGRSLTEILDAGPLPVPRTIRLAADLAGALAAAHRVGVVHRDVKPQNIMVIAGDQPKLVDFGLAVHSQRSAHDETAGTFAYCAPEQTGMLSRTVDGRADLYSLGVVLFECLTGTRPFDAARLSLEAACAGEPDPVRRAELLGLVAEAQQHDFAAAEAVSTVRRALAEAGHRLPTNPLLIVSTIWLLLAGFVAGRRLRRDPAAPLRCGGRS
ncbi:serine/threonine protein kinase [Dactylosporangium sp. NBC_01737]|uniref:serine/threonine-protein kinase n=1 Tax=Dactylosporangium sp. NBC_01737 TaxID=2975959 RepID=UPI002E158327|nr:serine/threonine protein kinase [Dactylosporangium sp. NBC_01737]